VHSQYLRWSTQAVLGWTPDPQTLIELSTAFSDGEAAYADRTMDGTKFARENLGLKFERREISPVVTSVEAQVYYNYIDHVMDNFTLRTPPGPPPGMRMLSNPDRRTIGGRAQLTLAPTDATELALGADAQNNRHTVRGTTVWPPFARRTPHAAASFRVEFFLRSPIARLSIPR